MEMLIITLILMTLWMSACTGCLVLGIIYGKKLQNEYKEAPTTLEEKRKKEREHREFMNFMTYNGDSQE